MKKLIALYVMCLPMLAQGAWVDASGKTVPDTENMRSSGDFGVQLVLTPDEKLFRQAWNSTKGTPQLKSTKSVRRGASLGAMLIFHGCMVNSAGVCDVVAEFMLEGPDGKRMPAGGGPVWSDAPLQSGLLQLGRANMSVGFDSSDAIGGYKVLANVKDNVSGRALSLTARFEVVK